MKIRSQSFDVPGWDKPYKSQRFDKIGNFLVLIDFNFRADGDIFNVCDGEESKMTDYFNAITDLLNLPRLPQVPLAEARKVMSPLMFSYMTESRKISNRKMIEKLGIVLKYPTMQAGLPASL